MKTMRLSRVVLGLGLLSLFPCSLSASSPKPDETLSFRVKPNGSIALSDSSHEIARIEPEVFTEGWKFNVFGLSMGEDPNVTGFCGLGPNQSVDLKVTVEALPKGLHIRYVLVPRGNIRCVQVRIPLYLLYNEWQETPYQLDAYNGKIPTNAPGGVGLIAQAGGKPLALGPSPALGNLQLQVDPGSTHIYLQDNRKWGTKLVAYLTHNEPSDKAWDWKSGEEKVFDFTLTSNRPLGSTPIAPAQASAKGYSGDWYGTGTLSGEAVTLLLALRAEKGKDGKITMTYEDIQDGLSDQPMKGKITWKGRHFRAVDNPNITDLTLDPSGNFISGTQKTKDKVYALHFTRGPDYSLPRVDGQGQPVTQYTYQPPQDLKDGLPVADLRQEKADLNLITDGMDKVLDGTFSHIHSLAVIHHGKLVMDEYFHGLGPQDPHALYSTTKSVFSTLFGIAQDQGLLNVNQKLYDFYPDYRSKPGWDPRKDKITFGLLLCMTSGFQCDNIANTCNVWESPDWLSYTLSLPLNHDPGTHWTYNGTSLIPLSNLLAQKSGLSIPDFAQKFLEGPLGIEKHPWQTGPNGLFAVDTGHSLTPREMAKLGLLYLDKGMWQGKRILSEQWTQDVGVKHAADFDYGYLFWLKNPVIHGRTIHIVEANGWAGQYIFIVPEMDIVGVMTAGNSQMGADFTLEESFFEKYILGSFLN